jgi:hypothetical protein
MNLGNKGGSKFHSPKFGRVFYNIHNFVEHFPKVWIFFLKNGKLMCGTAKWAKTEVPDFRYVTRIFPKLCILAR